MAGCSPSGGGCGGRGASGGCSGGVSSIGVLGPARAQLPQAADRDAAASGFCFSIFQTSGAKVQDHQGPLGPPLRNSGGDVTDGHPKTDQMGLKAGPPPAGKPGSACEVPLWRSPPNPPSSCLLPSCFPGGHLPGCLGNMRSGHDKHVATGLSQPSVSQGCRGGRGWGELSSCGRASGAPEGSPGTPKPHRHGPGDAA